MRDLLEPAVEATRRALRRMEPDDIPARLRRVAGISAKRLTAPHADRVLGELEASEWLRAKALEHWEEVPPSSVKSSVAAEQYLRRPEGWEMMIRTAELEAQRESVASRQDALEAENRTLKSRIEVLRHQIKSERVDAELALAEATRRTGVKAGREGTGLEALKRKARELESGLEAATADRHKLEIDLDEADARISFLLERGWRRDPINAQAPTMAAFGRGAPQAAARTLDHLAAALEPASPRRPSMAVPDPQIPKGLRPDLPEAIDWILSLTEPSTVLVDGYNVAHAMGTGTDAVGRVRVAAGVARLRRRASAPLTARLFWDSALGVDSIRGDGVIVDFVESADDAIVAAASGARGFTVVISSDRDVRERSNAGLAVWSEAFAAWL